MASRTVPGPRRSPSVSSVDLHLDPPMTLGRVTRRVPWFLPAALGFFLLLAAGALFNVLPWDEPITRWLYDLRTPTMNSVVRKISFLGSNKVVFPVAGIAALLAAKRCPRLAVAIVVIALCRPVAEFVIKDLVSRARPEESERLVRGVGYSFPSGHPLATASSWGLLPLVFALYTRRRAVWWAATIGVWVLALLIAMSRVWLGVHYTSDVVAALVLSVLGVALAERALGRAHRTECKHGRRRRGSVAGDGEHVHPEVVDAEVLQAAS
jgi:membrane-associated phospholipid phosphatase